MCLELHLVEGSEWGTGILLSVIKSRLSEPQFVVILEQVYFPFFMSQVAPRNTKESWRMVDLRRLMSQPKGARA